MKLYLAIVLFFFTLVLNAQQVKQAPNLIWFDDRPLNFGFLIGFNTMNYKVVHPKTLPPDVPRRYADVLTLGPGINLGMVSNFRINKYISLRVLPGLCFGGRDLEFINDKNYIDDPNDKYFPDYYTIVETSSTYLECPVILKFNGARMMNAKPYFMGGVNFRYDLAKSKKVGMMIDSFDIYWELGAGIDSYLTFFRLATEFKISIGLLNILNPAGTGESEDIYYTKVLDKLFSRIFILTFYFE